MDAKREKTWMVGDTHLDILSAKAAAVKHVAVSSGYESRETLEKYAETVKNDVFEAVKFIKNNQK
jgi:phosphoglycolate phosphatase